MATFRNSNFIPGTTGNLYIAGTSPYGVPVQGFDYAADSWSWDTTASVIELATVSSCPFVDNQTGLERLSFRAGGSAIKTFNPFNPANAGTGNPYLGTYCTVRVTAFAGGSGLPIQAAFCNFALVTHWLYTVEADGVCKWLLECVGGWQFSDMFNRVDAFG